MASMSDSEVGLVSQQLALLASSFVGQVIKCKHLLSTRKIELIHCNLNLLNLLNLTSGAGVSLCGPYASSLVGQVMLDREKMIELV